MTSFLMPDNRIAARIGNIHRTVEILIPRTVVIHSPRTVEILILRTVDKEVIINLLREALD